MAGSLNPSESFLQILTGELDQGGAPVWAGVGHIAFAKVFQELFDLLRVEVVIGFHRMPAHGLGNDILAEAHLVDGLAGSLELIDHLQGELFGVGHFDERRQGIEEEGLITEFTDSNAQFDEGGHLFPEKL